MTLNRIMLSAAGAVAPVVAVACLAGPAAGAAAPAGDGRVVTAVVAVDRSAALPLAAPGVRVVTTLPHIGAEIVHGSQSALRRLAAVPGVTGVSPDTAGHVTGRGYGSQNGSGSSPSSAGVFAPAAVGGSAGRPGAGAGVTVALLDTGVDDTAALNRSSGRLIDGIDLSGITTGAPPRTTGPFTDGYGHGTFLASLIAGGPTPGSGGQAVGVAPAAKIVDVKVAGSDGTTSLWQILAGLDWVAAHASTIQIVNLSFAMTPATFPVYGEDPLTAAVEDVRAAGVEVVAAVGNTPGQVGDPGMDPQALTVGAFDSETSDVASFSGSGSVDGVAKPDVVAAGVDILGAMAPGTEIAIQHPSAWQADGLFRGSGTSESTAIVSGVAAVVLAAHPGLDPAQLKAAIRLTAFFSADPRAGAGIVGVEGARARPYGSGGGSSVLAAKFGDCGWRSADPTGESCLDRRAWSANAWLGGSWAAWLASSWSASSWSASSWSASSWSASSWSASSWSDAWWGNGP